MRYVATSACQNVCATSERENRTNNTDNNINIILLYSTDKKIRIFSSLDCLARTHARASSSTAGARITRIRMPTCVDHKITKKPQHETRMRAMLMNRQMIILCTLLRRSAHATERVVTLCTLMFAPQTPGGV